MIRPDKIKSSFYKLVGFNEPTKSLKLTDNTALELDGDNLTSFSGLFYDDIPFVTIQNIFDSQEDKDINNDQFNAYLKRLSESAIVQFCNKVIAGENKYIKNINVYPWEKSFKNTLPRQNRFVGFEIENLCKDDKVIQLPWIELAFDSDVTFYVYLFNSNRKDYVNRISVSAKANEATVVNLVDSTGKPWFIADDQEYKGGNWYLGYFDDEIGTAKAIKRDWEFSNVYVTSPYYYVMPVSLSHSSNIIDVTSRIDQSDSYGLNFGMEIYKDYTEKFIRNKHLFASGIQNQMGEKVINQIKVSTRSNRIRNMMKEEQILVEINFQLYGNEARGIDGIQGKLKRQVDTLRKMFFYKPQLVRSTMR